MKKILYFDNWDKGYRNFLRLDSKFKGKGFQTLLLHTTSLTDSYVKPEKEVEGLKFRDISYYNTIRLKNIIKKENPSAIIMLNLSFILDRVIVQICQDMGICVFYLAHGKLVAIDSVNTVKDDLKKETLFSKINKKNLYSLYNYFLGLKNIKGVFVFFYKILTNPTEFIILPKYCKELDVNKSFVYYPLDFELMVKEFGFPKNKVQVVGNPELDYFFNTDLKNKLKFCHKELNIEGNKYVAYLDDGLSTGHNWDTKKWIEFLKEINNILKKNSLELVVKLHPRREIDSVKKFFEENNIKYFYDIDFKNFLNHSLFVISHFSSVIVYALLLRKKVKSPRWGLSRGIVKQYPEGVVNYYNDVKTFENSLFNVEVNEGLIQNYILNTIGEVNGKSIDMIVNEVTKEIMGNV